MYSIWVIFYDLRLSRTRDSYLQKFTNIPEYLTLKDLFQELSFEDVAWLIPMSTSRNEMALFEALTGWLRYSVGNRQKYLSSTMALIKFRKVYSISSPLRNVYTCTSKFGQRSSSTSIWTQKYKNFKIRRKNDNLIMSF